jgi:hypothetical protein
VDFANGLDSKIGWIINNDVIDGSQPKPITLIGSNLSTATNRAYPRWIKHNGLVKNGVNKRMFTLYIYRISPDNDAWQWVVDGCWRSKRNEGFALLLK